MLVSSPTTLSVKQQRARELQGGCLERAEPGRAPEHHREDALPRRVKIVAPLRVFYGKLLARGDHIQEQRRRYLWQSPYP